MEGKMGKQCGLGYMIKRMIISRITQNKYISQQYKFSVLCCNMPRTIIC